MRGGALLAEPARPRAAPVRYLSYTVDTVLLTAALMLLTSLPGAMFANGWLTVKLSLVVLDIVLGVFALNRAKTPRGRLLAYLAALAIFATIYSIAAATNRWGGGGCCRTESLQPCRNRERSHHQQDDARQQPEAVTPATADEGKHELGRGIGG